MNFDLHIQNIGKLTDAKIRIGRFTVFAGPNNTGKSFVSKIVYSLFNAMNANHAEVHINNLTDSVWKNIETLERRYEGLDDFLSPLRDGVYALHEMVEKSPVGDVDALDKAIPELAREVNYMQETVKENRPSVEWKVREDFNTLEPVRGRISDELDAIEQSLIELEEELGNMNAMEFIGSGIEYRIEENLIQNFQIPNLSDLRGAEDAPSQVDINNFGTFEFSNGNIDFEVDRDLLNELQRFSNVLYVESPAYWKLKNALEDLRMLPKYLRSKRERLSGVPRYFYDLVNALRSEYAGEMAFQDVYERLTGKEVLGGKVVISDTGAFLFQEDDRSFTMPVTAMGVANLGILALLIERKVMDQETFIFIDEPEAHLHPAWQVVMAKALFDLAKGGANVVIATHSVDILKWLEVHVKNHPEDEAFVVLNKFPVNGDDSGERGFAEKLEDMKLELARPFADLHVRSL